MAATLLIIYALLLPSVTQAAARTVVFNLLIYFHLLFVLIIGWQSLRRGNFFLVATVLIILALQLLITYIPFFQEIFQLEI
jgi:magnesium-transporting ATPase (P-type)